VDDGCQQVIAPLPSPVPTSPPIAATPTSKTPPGSKTPVPTPVPAPVAIPPLNNFTSVFRFLLKQIGLILPDVHFNVIALVPLLAIVLGFLVACCGRSVSTSGQIIVRDYQPPPTQYPDDVIPLVSRSYVTSNMKRDGLHQKKD
jgi:hypothetical protein